MSNGMYCSASQRIDSSSSSRVIVGRLIFFTITEWPDTAVATFFAADAGVVDRLADRLGDRARVQERALDDRLGRQLRDAEVRAARCPCGLTATSTALTDEEPMSRPTIDLDFPRKGSATVASSGPPDRIACDRGTPPAARPADGAGSSSRDRTRGPCPRPSCRARAGSCAWCRAGTGGRPRCGRS